MALSTRTRLGPYEIVGALGAGGMGEVYRAKDTRLGRDVALKVLPSDVGTDADRLARFAQEARTVSALNHPNIITIYDVGVDPAAPYVVFELLEGATLRVALADHRISTTQALDYAAQIAEGLAAAHDHGIVHRDLKPENVFITRDARVKILDFGLAKVVAPIAPARTTAVLVAAPLDTQPGAVLGTVGYMSPEQVHGQAVDHRSDLFSLGAILYEMLAGRRAFQGGSSVETMSAIITQDPPPLATLDPDLPLVIERVVRRCLQKRVEARFQSARDLAFALQIASSAPSRLVEQKDVGRAVALRYAVGVVTISLALVLAYLIVHAGLIGRERTTPSFPIRVSIPPPENTLLSSTQLALSPDGTRVAFVGISGERRQVWLYSLNAAESHVLAGTEGANFPFWSADGQHIGFVTDRGLMRISIAGGPSQDLAMASLISSGAWSEEGVVLFAGDERPGIYRISSSGGTPQAITTPNASRDELLHLHPRYLPGGKRFLYFVRSRKPEFTGVYVRSLDADDSKLLIHTLSHAEYVAPGYLLFVRESVLFAQPFNLSRLELEGDPFPIAEAVTENRDKGGSGFSVSRDGSLVYHAADPQTQLKWVDRQGTVMTLVGPRDFYRGVELSPDHRTVLVRVRTRGRDASEAADVWTIDPSRDIRSRLTVEARSQNARWSPDGQHIFFDSHRASNSGIYRKRSDGSGPEELVWKTEGTLADVAKNGQLLVEERQACTVISPLGERKATTFIDSPFISSCGRFSADGRFIAYTQNESERSEVYVVPFPEGTPRRQVSKDGGREPRWRTDGRELFYVSQDGALTSVTLTYAGRLQASPPRELFRAGSMTSGPLGGRVGLFWHWQYSLSDDGQRFLVIDAVDTHVTGLTVIAHWSQTLKQ